jgi:hypothetical protein
MMEYRIVSHKKSDSLNRSSEENLVLLWGKYSVASFLIEGSSDWSGVVLRTLEIVLRKDSFPTVFEAVWRRERASERGEEEVPARRFAGSRGRYLEEMWGVTGRMEFAKRRQTGHKSSP